MQPQTALQPFNVLQEVASALINHGFTCFFRPGEGLSILHRVPVTVSVASPTVRRKSLNALNVLHAVIDRPQQDRWHLLKGYRETTFVTANAVCKAGT
jgi:hypothetical protein